jgi:predicted RNA-binding protein with PUA-like domain
MKYWLIKSEPFKYSWEQFCKDKRTFWDGVRNYQARNNLKAMSEGDWAFFYHSNEGLCIIGLAKVVATAYPDPTSNDPQWVAVDLVPIAEMSNPISLKTIKEDPILQEMALVKQGRLSVSPVTEVQADHLLRIGNPKEI